MNASHCTCIVKNVNMVEIGKRAVLAFSCWVCTYLDTTCLMLELSQLQMC